VNKIRKRAERIIGRLNGKRVKMTEKAWKHAIDTKQSVVFK
jgi:hypothetical protein